MAHRILVLRAGALGDAILTLPALRVLRNRYPDAQLTVVGYPRLWDVAGSLVDEVVSIDATMFGGLFSENPSPGLQDWLQGFDLAIAWTARDVRSSLESAGIPEVVYASPYPPPGVHAAAWLVSSVFRTTDPSGGCLEIADDELERATDDLRRMGMEQPALIHPGAGAYWKRWPARRFAALGDALAQRGMDVALIAGPADADAIACVQEHAAQPFPVLRDLPLRRLAATLAQAGMFVGNDSGVTHLAAAAGAPVVALFGSTDPATWAPLGDVEVIRACNKPATAQGQIRVCEDPRCMEAILPEDVMERIKIHPPRRHIPL